MITENKTRGNIKPHLPNKKTKPPPPMHASAPEGYKCADCEIDQTPCQVCIDQ